MTNFGKEVTYLRHWSTLSEAVLPLPLSEAYCATYSSEENFPKLLGTHVYKNCHKANVNEHGEWQWMYHLIWNQWWQEQRVSNKNQQKTTLFDVQVIKGKLKIHDTEAQKHISIIITEPLGAQDQMRNSFMPRIRSKPQLQEENIKSTPKFKGVSTYCSNIYTKGCCRARA